MTSGSAQIKHPSFRDLTPAGQAAHQWFRQLARAHKTCRLYKPDNPMVFQIRDQLKSGQYVLLVPEDGSDLVLSYNGVELERGSPGLMFGSQSGFSWVPPTEALTRGREIRFRLLTPRQASAQLANQLTPTIDPRGSRVVTAVAELSSGRPHP